MIHTMACVKNNLLLDILITSLAASKNVLLFVVKIILFSFTVSSFGVTSEGAMASTAISYSSPAFFIPTPTTIIDSSSSTLSLQPDKNNIRTITTALIILIMLFLSFIWGRWYPFVSDWTDIRYTFRSVF